MLQLVRWFVEDERDAYRYASTAEGDEEKEREAGKVYKESRTSPSLVALHPHLPLLKFQRIIH